MLLSLSYSVFHFIIHIAVLCNYLLFCDEVKEEPLQNFSRASSHTRISKCDVYRLISVWFQVYNCYPAISFFMDNILIHCTPHTDHLMLLSVCCNSLCLDLCFLLLYLTTVLLVYSLFVFMLSFCVNSHLYFFILSFI